MVEPFKNLLSQTLVRACARRLHAVWAAFDQRRFERLALDGLDDMEMKARAMHIADALEATLPGGDAAGFARACEVIEAALGPPVPVDGVAGTPVDLERGLAGWIVWPLGEFVARRGIEHPERALQALHALTQRLTAEFAIRPLIVAHPQLVFATLQRWTSDPSAHVRRLVSEGSRPRLPWGLRLQALVDDPSPTLPMLAALQDDPSDYVRRSVANHLNDIAKDHPQLVVGWIGAHLDGASDARRALLKHASRTLIKQGHAPMLELWGAGQAFEGRLKLALAPKQLRVGETLTMVLELKSAESTVQRLLVDYAVHYVKANGSTSPKVFKGWTLTLGPGLLQELRKSHSMREVTTRRLQPGRHRVVIHVNGRPQAEKSFTLTL